MAKLTKAQILDGINKPKEFEIEALGCSIWLRALSNAELDELDKIEAKGMESYETNSRNRGGVEDTVAKGKLNMVIATRTAAEARDRKVQMSLDNPKNDEEWTLEEIGMLPRGAVNEIIEKINELSGVGVTKSDIDRFPENE